MSLCYWGLHASIRPLDALYYAPGPIICRVELSGDIVTVDDKAVATRREVLWMADATDTLRAFARSCALDVIHLWDAPAVVVEYLNTGDEALRATALSAARATARATALSAARASARASARATAEATAEATARAAARDDAWDVSRKKQNKRLAEMLEGLAS